MLWKRIALVSVNVVLAAYLVLAMSAFNHPDEAVVCHDIDVTIEESDMPGFLTSDEVRQMLVMDKLSPIGKPLTAINLRQMEETLEAKELIEDAECWTTQDGTVRVDVQQRIPVMRVMNCLGEDYYIDTHGKPMPRTQYSCKLIVCTGYVSKQYAEKVLAPMANIINNDEFWKSEITQLNVLADGSVELVPRVGGHIAYLGQPRHITSKLERLRKFYRYGLNVAGWNKYSRVSVEYGNQIICKRRPTKK